MEGDNGNVFNSGIVTSDNEAINIDGTGNEVVNTGILSAIDHGVEFNTLTSEVNVLVNSGRIESSNLSNPTVRGDFGDETVVNSGLIVGSVSLGAGNDVFNGRGGTVTGSILGGAGDDLFIIDDASTEIVELSSEGTDEVRSFVSYKLAQNFENLKLRGASDLNGTGNALANTLTGNEGDNILKGRKGNDTLAGNDGDDTLFGQKGKDLLQGQAGDDRILGGDSVDTIDGGADDDRLTGGGGNDKFIFADGFGKDVITDFDEFKNGEKIDLSAVATITDLADLKADHLSQSGAHAVINAGGGNTITLLNVNISDLNAGDFIF